MRRIIFSTLNKKKWIENIVFSRQFINEDIQLEFSESILESKLLPVHLVTLACLIDEYNKSGKKVYLFSRNNDLLKYLIEDLRFNTHLKLNDYNRSILNSMANELVKLQEYNSTKHKKA